MIGHSDSRRKDDRQVIVWQGPGGQLSMAVAKDRDHARWLQSLGSSLSAISAIHMAKAKPRLRLKSAGRLFHAPIHLLNRSPAND